jgi:hypothetical protein
MSLRMDHSFTQSIDLHESWWSWWLLEHVSQLMLVRFSRCNAQDPCNMHPHCLGATAVEWISFSTKKDSNTGGHLNIAKTRTFRAPSCFMSSFTPLRFAAKDTPDWPAEERHSAVWLVNHQPVMLMTSIPYQKIIVLKHWETYCYEKSRKNHLLLWESTTNHLLYHYYEPICCLDNRDG